MWTRAKQEQRLSGPGGPSTGLAAGLNEHSGGDKALDSRVVPLPTSVNYAGS